MGDVLNQVNTQVQGVGDDIASATSIAVSSVIQRVTGTASIQTITPPPGFSGPIFLLSRDGFSFITGGNIANAVAVPSNALATLVYTPQLDLWWVTDVAIADGSITTAKLAPGAASANGSVTDNTVQVIGTSDTGVASFSVNVNAITDFVMLHGRTIFSVTNYDTTTAPNIVTKLWRGPVTTGVLVDSVTGNLTASSGSTLDGSAAAPFNFFDTGISGPTTYNLSISCAAGPTFTKTSTVAWCTDLRAQ